jgi:hypothetical protein
MTAAISLITKQNWEVLTGNKHFSAGTLLDKAWGISVNGAVFVGSNRSALIDGLTDDINNSAESLGSNRH